MPSDAAPIAAPLRAHAWCSIALPFDVTGVDPNARARIVGQGAAVPRLRQMAHAMADAFLDRPGDTSAHLMAGRELAGAAVACLTGADSSRPAVGRPRLDRSVIIRRAMAAVEAAAVVPDAADLAATVGVTSRTLLRAFREAYGISPKRYLMLRELHAVRRQLVAGCCEGLTVADVLTRHGIWEFGRFACRYRLQFGELPSETLRRVRGTAGRQDHPHAGVEPRSGSTVAWGGGSGMYKPPSLPPRHRHQAARMLPMTECVRAEMAPGTAVSGSVAKCF